MTEQRINQIGWFSSIMSIAMYFSYIDQIVLNLSGHTGSVLLPVVTTINCIAWVLYASMKTTKDWPIIVSNVPGILLGIITATTAII
jgi:hypothetical protein